MKAYLKEFCALLALGSFVALIGAGGLAVGKHDLPEVRTAQVR